MRKVLIYSLLLVLGLIGSQLLTNTPPKISTGISLATMFALVYKTVPDAHVAWGDAWVGAAVTAVLFTVGTMALSLFLGTTGGASVYGTAASVLALLIWVYYSAQVFFFGAEVTRIFANVYGAHIVPRHHSVRDLLRARLVRPRGA